jgi:hypothetical protein
MKNPAAGGGRWVEVPPERLATWIVSFTQRHGDADPRWPRPGDDGAVVTFTAADGAVAECHVPFPPLGRGDLPGTGARAAAGAIVAHTTADRTVGVLLVRLGGYAVGVFSGSPPGLASSKVGRRLVHGRSAAGGWSQHRFARRRENQAAAALRAAADAAAGILGPYGPGGLDAVVLGGDKRSVAALRDDARLAPYLDRATDRFLTVPDPSPAVLRDIPASYLAIRIRLSEPEPDSPVRADQVN